jgi:3-oxoacyl-[acyl-carrier-protein] synthase III
MVPAGGSRLPYRDGRDEAERYFVMRGQQVGNTAAASIPLALAHGAESGALRVGERIVLTAFGGGLTWGSTLLRWPEIVCGTEP